METSLRLGLLLIGFIIVIGIIWDSRRSSKRTKKLSKERNTIDLKKDAFLEEYEFEETVFVQNKPISSTASPSLTTSPKRPALKHEEIILLHVMAKFGGFSGGDLLDAFHELNLYYGDRQIFYRYENIDGTGNTMFNLVSAVEPGYFEISKMENFTTPGIILFFTLTKPNQSIAAFELMLRTAKQLAIRLNGEVLDERRHLLTVPVIEQYRERVRKFSPQFQANRLS